MSKKETGKLFTIRCYCKDCKKLLLESNPMTRMELIVNWDQAVLTGPNIPCKDCGHEVPNFHIYLKIHDKRGDKEYDPQMVLPRPRATVTFEGLEKAFKESKGSSRD